MRNAVETQANVSAAFSTLDDNRGDNLLTLVTTLLYSKCKFSLLVSSLLQQLVLVLCFY